MDSIDNQARKKIKLANDETKLKNEESIKLDQLNEDCILAILKYLDPDDLYAVSETCVRLKRLANNHFKRTYFNILPDEIGVSVKDGEITVSPERFLNINVPVKHFVSCIQVVYINRLDRKYIAKLVRFLRTNWIGNLKILHFQYGNYIESFRNMEKLSFDNKNNIASLGQNIATVLQDVEVLSFDFVPERSEAVNEMLKYCPQLKSLQIKKGFLSATDEYTQCPTLEMIECRIYTANCVEKITAFLQRNRNVSKLFCQFDDQPSRKWKPMLASVVELVLTTDSISELYIEIAENHLSKPKKVLVPEDWNTIHHELKKLDANARFKRLELSIYTTEWQMGALQSLSGLHLDFHPTTGMKNILSTINQMAQLKTLCMQFLFSLRSQTVTACTSLSQNLPNLEEVHLIVDEIHDNFFEFVSRSPKLSKLVLRLIGRSSENHYRSYENVRIQMGALNEMRRKLHNACKMVIYICEAYNYKYDFPSTNPNQFPITLWDNKDDLVSLRAVKLLNWFPHAKNPLLPAILNEN